MRERNGDSSKINDSSNAPMTSAERQRRYRDRRRGGPPRGRWPEGYVPVGVTAKLAGTNRSYAFYAAWMEKHAPDALGEVLARKLKIAPIYERLRREYDRGIIVAVGQPHGETDELVTYRDDGHFVFDWVARSTAVRLGREHEVMLRTAVERAGSRENFNSTFVLQKVDGELIYREI